MSLIFEYVLLGISPVSNCSWPTFRNPVLVPSSKAGGRLSNTSLWRWNQYRVPKRRPTTIWRRGNTQKNIFNIQITAKVWNQESSWLFILLYRGCTVTKTSHLPIRYFLALWAHPIPHISTIRVNEFRCCFHKHLHFCEISNKLHVHCVLSIRTICRILLLQYELHLLDINVLLFLWFNLSHRAWLFSCDARLLTCFATRITSH